MSRALTGEVELEYQLIGDAGCPVLMLIAGLGQQMIWWEDRFCRMLADSGLHVLRFDNRDVGLSSYLDHMGKVRLAGLRKAVRLGEPVSVPYQLRDMAADAAGLLDHLDVPAAHVAGVSMGGMIGQELAIGWPDRVVSLTSIMSTTGHSEVGRGTAAATATLYTPSPVDKLEAIDRAIAAARVIGSPGMVDEARVAGYAAAAHERGFNPAGVGRQLAAVLGSPDRTAALADLTVPALVIHGPEDTLIDISGGHATAAAIPGARIEIVEGMGHDVPEALWPLIVDLISTHIHQAELRRRGAGPRHG